MTAIPVTTYAPLNDDDLRVLRGAPYEIPDVRCLHEDIMLGASVRTLERRHYLAPAQRYVGRTVLDDYTVFTRTRKGEEAIR
jgi:hypothetical protein